jgi:hypothetical protein
MQIVVILKKNNKLKIYVDFKQLNIVTKKDSYPLPFCWRGFEQNNRSQGLFIFGGIF